MKLILLLLSCFFSALGLGYAKFFVLGYLSADAYAAEDKIWLIQAINSLLTVGPVFIYVFTAPLVSSCKKRHVMTASALLTGVILTLGHFSGWPGSPSPMTITMNHDFIYCNFPDSLRDPPRMANLP